MPNIGDYKPEGRYVMLFVGDSGSGKSTAAASFQDPYHELDADNRFGGIYQSAQQGILKGSRKISYQPFSLLGGWEPISKELNRLNQSKVIYRQNPGMYPFPYSTIGLGSLGSLCQVIQMLAFEKLPGHQKVGDLLLASPGDVRAELSGVNQVLNYLFDMPCNIIVTCHIIERWGKPPIVNEEDRYKPSIVIGERLNVSPNIAASTVGRFDNVFKFYSELVGNEIKYKVIFADGDLTKNGFGIPPGSHDITGKEFYPFFQSMVAKYRKETVAV